MDELTHLDHAAQLGTLQQALNDKGAASQLFEPNERLPVTTLMIDVGPDDAGRDRVLAASIMPLADDGLDDTQLVQFYAQMPFAIDDESLASVQRAVPIVNAALAIGHFGMQNGELFYRYVLAMPNGATFDLAMTVEIVALMAFHQEHFGDFFEGIVDDEITLSTLPDLLAAG